MAELQAKARVLAVIYRGGGLNGLGDETDERLIAEIVNGLLQAA